MNGAADLAVEARRINILEKDAVTADSMAQELDGTFAMRTALPPAGRWSLRMSAADARNAATVGPFDTGQAINTLREVATGDGGTRLSARLGPDEWLLIEEAGSLECGFAALTGSGLMSGMATADPWSLVDIGHRHAAIELGGSRARDVLNTGCALDLSDRAFPAGTATRTLFAKAEIVLMRRGNADAAPNYRLECGRSFGRYLRDYLLNSAELLGAAA